jgi:NAD(P)-dependent dehydrogenase (short-subunit alcohol dehydrogenase family)
MDFKGKKVVVTGSSSGIGRAAAVLLAKEGADVILAARDTIKLIEVKKEIEALGRKAHAIPCDVADDKSVDAMKDEALKFFGHIDLLINNAGIGMRGALEDASLDDWRYIINTNLMGQIRTVHAFLPHFLGRGTGYICNVSSIQAMGYGMEDLNIPYTTTKAGIIGFTEGISSYLGQRGIKVSILIPGGVYTNIGGSSRFVGSKERQHELRERDSHMNDIPGFLTAEQCASGMLEGIKREDYMIMTPPGMAEIVKAQGKGDINAFNDFVKSWKPRPMGK